MPQTGLFGKLPALGDFVSRRLAESFREPWDAWLAQVLADWRAYAGGDWGARFDAWAPTCFAVDAGLCGPEAAVGLFVASQDRVGRRFPLTVAIVLPAGSDALGFALRTERWMKLGLAVLRDITAAGADAAGLEPALDELDRVLAEVAESAPVDTHQFGVPLAHRESRRIALPAETGLAYPLGALGIAEFRRTARVASAFWPLRGAGPLIVSGGLPDSAAVIGLYAASPGARASAPAPERPPIERRAVPRAAPAVAAAPIGDNGPDPVLVSAPGVAYVACYGWGREGAADAAIAQRFLDTFRADPDAARALTAAFGQSATSGGGSAWVPDEDGGRFAWFGSAAVFRLRGAELSRLAAPAEAQSGQSLADLLGSAAPASGTSVVPADVQDGDRVLLCADGSYGKLSWGQLMSALQEQRAARAASRLAEIWQRPDARVPGAIVLAFDETDAGLEATHALVPAPVAPAD